MRGHRNRVRAAGNPAARGLWRRVLGENGVQRWVFYIPAAFMVVFLAVPASLTLVWSPLAGRIATGPIIANRQMLGLADDPARPAPAPVGLIGEVPEQPRRLAGPLAQPLGLPGLARQNRLEARVRGQAEEVIDLSLL